MFNSYCVENDLELEWDSSTDRSVLSQGTYINKYSEGMLTNKSILFLYRRVFN